jgi:hypothetical protein
LWTNPPGSDQGVKPGAASEIDDRASHRKNGKDSDIGDAGEPFACGPRDRIEDLPWIAQAESELLSHRKRMVFARIGGSPRVCYPHTLP